MKFVRAVWKLLVGIKDALVLVFMMLFFGLLYAGLSARPAAIGEGVLDLNLKGAIVEQPENAEWADIAGAPRSATMRSTMSSRRSTPPRTTAGSRPSRSISTASPAAARAR